MNKLACIAGIPHRPHPQTSHFRVTEKPKLVIRNQRGRKGRGKRYSMTNIHQQCVDAAEEYGEPGNLVMGANIAGFLKVAHAMLDQGVV